MSRTLIVTRIGPGASVQDAGRAGLIGRGLSRGGAADRIALAEGAALLGQGVDCAAIEMPMMGGSFEVSAPAWIALSGAPMGAKLGARKLSWNACYRMEPGEVLSLGAASVGVYGYLHVEGGIATEPVLESRAAHLVAGLGAVLEAGAELPLGPPGKVAREQVLEVEDRFHGGTLRIVPAAQTGRFAAETRTRFEDTVFARARQGNRQGVKLSFEGAAFGMQGQLNIVSEVITPGDIQMTGDGQPYVLLVESQTMGGYPRIASVIPADLPRVAQAAPGAELRFRFVELEEALATLATLEEIAKAARGRVRPLVRDPAEIPDLLSYQLIDGVVSGRE